ncbi:MAG: terminase, partial [Cyanobacteria bacterium REEB65]|nr:terminase [Cyanobacteria bacterium REEB65]
MPRAEGASAFAYAADQLDPARRDDYATPGELAKALNAETVQTPALSLIDTAIADVGAGRCNRLIVSVAPQEGKSERVTHYGVLWLLRRNHNLRIGIVSYGEDIARRFSYLVRADVTTFDGTDGTIDLGLRLRGDSTAAGDWNLAPPARGGVKAVGIGGGLTGRPLDLLVIDDPVKDYRAADSILLSEIAWQWWMSVARPRLAPNAPVIIILTRWHERDLAGRAIDKEAEDRAAGLEHFDRWRVINIPAQADHDPERGQTDLLARQPGEFLVSARGRTQAQWEATKAATAPRIWTAL